MSVKPALFVYNTGRLVRFNMDPKKFKRMVHAIAKIGHSLQMIYAHDPLPRSTRLTFIRHNYVAKPH
jgi:hypothetical protein